MCNGWCESRWYWTFTRSISWAMESNEDVGIRERRRRKFSIGAIDNGRYGSKCLSAIIWERLSHLVHEKDNAGLLNKQASVLRLLSPLKYLRAALVNSVSVSIGRSKESWGCSFVNRIFDEENERATAPHRWRPTLSGVKAAWRWTWSYLYGDCKVRKATRLNNWCWNETESRVNNQHCADYRRYEDIIIYSLLRSETLLRLCPRLVSRFWPLFSLPPWTTCPSVIFVVTWYVCVDGFYFLCFDCRSSPTTSS